MTARDVEGAAGGPRDLRGPLPVPSLPARGESPCHGSLRCLGARMRSPGRGALAVARMSRVWWSVPQPLRFSRMRVRVGGLLTAFVKPTTDADDQIAKAWRLGVTRPNGKGARGMAPAPSADLTLGQAPPGRSRLSRRSMGLEAFAWRGVRALALTVGVLALGVALADVLAHEGQPVVMRS